MKVTDEICTCGAFKSQHNDTLSQGHGSCPDTGCSQFTWKAFVYGAGDSLAEIRTILRERVTELAKVANESLLEKDRTAILGMIDAYRQVVKLINEKTGSV